MGKGGRKIGKIVPLATPPSEVDFNQLLAGVPLRSLRDMFKTLADTDRLDAVDFSQALQIPTEQAQRLIKNLLEVGYLEPLVFNRVSDGKGRYGLTVAATRLAQKHLKRVSREVATRQLNTFLERVRDLESDSPFVFTISRVTLFGSLARKDAATVGDVDLVVELQAAGTYEQRRAASEAYLAAEVENGRHFSSFMARLMAPEADLWKYLRKNLSLLSLHTRADLEIAQSGVHQVLYKRPL